MPEVREIPLDQIRTYREIQPREELDPQHVELFREIYTDKESEPLPPVTVFHDPDGEFLLSDGFHRYEAARAALSEGGPSALPAEIREGNRRDAFLFAASVNGKHGKQLTPQEKRGVIRRMLADTECSQWSVRKIARHTGLSVGLVSEVRQELESQIATVHGEQYVSPKTVEYERDGKKQTMKTENLRGRSKRPKAKTETTTTTPVSPAITQDERPTDDDEEPQMDDSIEIVESGTTMGISDLTADAGTGDSLQEASWTGDSLRESEEHPDAVITEGFKYLEVAWETATDNDRYAFLKWIKTDEDQKRWHEAAGAALESFTLTRAPLR